MSIFTIPLTSLILEANSVVIISVVIWLKSTSVIDQRCVNHKFIKRVLEIYIIELWITKEPLYFAQLPSQF